MKLSEIAKKVIDLAGAIRSYWATELPKRHPDYPIVHVGENSGMPPPEDTELQGLLEGLPEDMVYKLLLIMYIGRGDFGTEDLAGHYKKLKETFAKPEWAISQMRGKAPMGDYLATGLDRLAKAEIDVDKINFRPVKPRKAR